MAKKNTKLSSIDAVQDGSHYHNLSRQILKTSGGNRHSHTFLVPDGHLIETTLSGSHTHEIQSVLSNSTDVDGEHAHTVRIGKEKLSTTKGGAHAHNLKAVSTDTGSGVHTHEFVFEGVTLKSLTGSEIYAWTQGGSSGLGLPLCDVSDISLRKCTDAQVVFLHRYVSDLYKMNFADGSSEKGFLSKALLLRSFSAVTKEIALRGLAETANEELLSQLEKAGRSIYRKFSGTFAPSDNGITFSLDNGDCWDIVCKRSYALDKCADVTPHGSYAYLPFSEDNMCPATKLDTPLAKSGDKSTVEVCFQSDSLVEYFVSSGPFSGYLLFKNTGSGWVCSSKPAGVPYVLSKEACTAGIIPTLGTSALPASLEQDIPFQYRYWKAATLEDSLNVRNKLYFSDLIDEDNIQKVHGSLRRLVKKYYLPQIDEVKGNLFPLEPSTLNEDTLVKAAFGASPVEFDGTVPEAPFFLKAPNTEDNLDVLSSFGRPFSLKKGSGEFLYVSSSPVKCLNQVIWQDRPRFRDENLGKILKSEHKVLVSKSEDEQIVFGIVLEPDTVDSQNDTYNAEEVEKAAHMFMEQHRNIGLQHSSLINNKVKILESYIAPVDFEVEGQSVKKGTWLMKERILDANLWKSIKDGEITGYSIGGTGVRTKKS